MHIFPAEKAAGLSEKLANNSIAYLTQATEVDISKIKVSPNIPNGNPDLFYLTSILASVGRNKNDDIFTKEDMWQARSTPRNKRINEEHDDSVILGVMINSYAVDDEGNEIPDDTSIEDLPDTFHIVDDSYIWTYWKDEAVAEHVTELISQIKNGDKYVSMECIFQNFDYAIWNDTEAFIVPRNEETSFLTEKLRIFGGDGKVGGNSKYKDFSIGRVMRDFVFSGKGIVSKPANPQSYIISTSSISNFTPKKVISDINFSESSVLISERDNLMSDEFKSKYEAAQADNEKLQKEIASLKSKLDEVNAKATENAVAEASKKVEELQTSLASLSEDNTKKATDLTVANETIQNFKKQIEDLEASKASLESEIKKIQEEAIAKAKCEKAADRKSMLVKCGLSEDVAEAKVASWESVGDEQFSEYVASLSKSAKANVDDILDEPTKEQQTDAVPPSPETKAQELITSLASLLSGKNTKGNK